MPRGGQAVFALARDFDEERIRSLSLYAATLSPELEAYGRYAKLNHFFTYGMDAEEREKERQAVHQALAGLKAYIHRAQTAGNETPGDGGACLNELPQALAADVNIMSPNSGSTSVGRSLGRYRLGCGSNCMAHRHRAPCLVGAFASGSWLGG